jgi:hypothetical protein
MTTATERTSESYAPLIAVIAALALIALLAGGGWQAYRYSQWRSFQTEKERIETIVESWQAPPADADPVQWGAAWETAYNAVGNVCFTPEQVNPEEMVRLREDVERRNQKPVNLETLAWLWSRLAQTGPHGNDYITRMQPLWDEAVAASATPVP